MHAGDVFGWTMPIDIPAFTKQRIVMCGLHLPMGKREAH